MKRFGDAPTGSVRVGISACLLGQAVRYDGGHKLDRLLRDTLGACVELVPVCPEAECGLGVPREPMSLLGDPGHPRLVTNSTGRDLTERLEAWARQRVRELEAEDLCGFVFKSRSPSCGLERVTVYDAGGVPAETGTGIFARIFREHFPLLPAEEEGLVHDAKIREAFIARVFAARGRSHA